MMTEIAYIAFVAVIIVLLSMDMMKIEAQMKEMNRWLKGIDWQLYLMNEDLPSNYDAEEDSE